MPFRARPLQAWILLLALATAGPSWAGIVRLDANTSYVMGVDPGVGPPLGSTSAPNSFQAASQFAMMTAGHPSTTIDFGSRFAGLQPSDNNVASATVDGVRVVTTGIDYSPAPAGYQYGVTTLAVPQMVAPTVGYAVNGPGYYAYVPLLSAASSSWTLHSDAGFSSFGFFLTGLGNSGGRVEVEINSQATPVATLTGSTTGGLEYYGYLGSTTIHDLTLVMPQVNPAYRDVFGVTDVTLVSLASVPEPPAYLLMLVALAGVLGGSALRRK